MKLGLLWYDGDPKKTLDAKLAEASVRYREKFGTEPTVCYLNPAQLGPQSGPAPAPRGKLKLVSAATILPNHLWLEIDQ